MKIQFNMKDQQKFVVDIESIERFQEMMKNQETIWQGEKNGLWVNQIAISSILFEKDEPKQETHVAINVENDQLIVTEKK